MVLQSRLLSLQDFFGDGNSSLSERVSIVWVEIVGVYGDKSHEKCLVLETDTDCDSRNDHCDGVTAVFVQKSSRCIAH